MGGLLQDRYRATIYHVRRSLPGLDFEEGGKFRGSIVNIRIVVTILLYVLGSLFLFSLVFCAKVVKFLGMDLDHRRKPKVVI